MSYVTFILLASANTHILDTPHLTGSGFSEQQYTLPDISTSIKMRNDISYVNIDLALALPGLGIILKALSMVSANKKPTTLFSQM